MKRMFCLITISLLPFVSAGQEAAISGVVNSEGKPVPYAPVAIPDLNIGAVAGSDGRFLLSDVPAGTHQLVVKALGFIQESQSVTIASGQTLSVAFSLRPDLLQLEEVVITGTRSPIQVHRAPVVVSRIGSKMLENTQSLSLAEGLHFTPGLRMETNCQNCGFTQVRMNGLEGPYSQILINGRPVFSALAGVYGLEMLPANMIERVEVVRGGGSVMYGGNAIAGTVNIITRTPTENAIEVGFNQSFTNAEIPDFTFSASGSVVSDDLMKGVTFYGFHRDRQPWDANADGLSELTLMQNNTFGADAFWNPDYQSKVRLNLYTMSEFRRGGSDFERPAHQSALAEELRHRLFGGQLSYERESVNEKHRFAAYTSLQQVARNSYYGAGGRVIAPGDSLTESDLLAINAYGQSYDISLVGGLQYAWQIAPSLLATMGSELQHNAVNDAMPGYARSIDQQVTTWGSYAQLEWKPVRKITVVAGGRYDQVNIDGSYLLGDNQLNDNTTFRVPVPRLSVMAELTQDLRFRTSFAQGYRAPQAFDEDLHIETVGGAARFTQLSPDLETERSDSFTASLNYAKTHQNFQLSLLGEYFYTALQNPFINSGQQELPDGTAIIFKRNGDAAWVQGLNIEANFAWGKGFVFQSGATIQNARYKEEEVLWSPVEDTDTRPPTTTRRLLRTPDVYGFYNFSFNPLEALGVSLSGVLTGPMNVAHVIDPETEFTVIEETPVFFEQHVRLTYDIKLSEQWVMQCHAGVKNLFNSFQQDFDTGVLRDADYVYGPAMPRSVFFGIRLRLGK